MVFGVRKRLEGLESWLWVIRSEKLREYAAGSNGQCIREAQIGRLFDEAINKNSLKYPHFSHNRQ